MVFTVFSPRQMACLYILGKAGAITWKDDGLLLGCEAFRYDSLLGSQG